MSQCFNILAASYHVPSTKQQRAFSGRHVLPYCVVSKYTCHAFAHWHAGLLFTGTLLVYCYIEAGQSACAIDQQEPGLKSLVQCFSYLRYIFIGNFTTRAHSGCYTLIHRLRGSERLKVSLHTAVMSLHQISQET